MWSSYSRVQAERRLLTLHFTSVHEYLAFLEAVAVAVRVRPPASSFCAAACRGRHAPCE